MSEGARNPRGERDERVRRDLAALQLPRDPTPEVAPGRAGPPGRTRRILRAALLVATALAVAAWIAWRWLWPSAVPVEVVRAESYASAADVSVPVLSGSGYLVPAQPFIAIGSRIAGRIKRYRVDEGDRVVAGDALVELDAAPYRATVRQLEASLASARARADLAARELDRARHLFGEGVISREAIDRRESEARVAAAEVEELRASLDRARIDLADTVIRAPTDGVVLETFKQPGEVAVPGGFSGSGDLLRLANLTELRAELDVNEADLVHISLGQAARVTPDAFPDRAYRGEVARLAPQIDRQKGTREVEVRVLEPDAELLPDMSVRVVFLSQLGTGGAAAATPGGAAPGAVIPRGALQRGADGRAFVWRVDGERARRVPVEVADVLGDRVVVREGLRGGEPVVVGGGALGDGTRVRALETDER